MKDFVQVLSFPKCGRTWILYFLQTYMHITGHQFSHVVFKHLPSRSCRTRIVLTRDPCDVMVSYYYHVTMRMGIDICMDDFIRHKRYGIPFYNKCYAKWKKLGNVVAYIDYKDLFGRVWCDILKLLNIPVDKAAVEEAVGLCQIDVIKKTLRGNKKYPQALFHPMLRGRRKTGYDVPNAHKFRRGVVGGYVGELTDEQIKYIRSFEEA